MRGARFRSSVPKCETAPQSVQSLTVQEWGGGSFRADSDSKPSHYDHNSGSDLDDLDLLSSFSEPAFLNSLRRRVTIPVADDQFTLYHQLAVASLLKLMSYTVNFQSRAAPLATTSA